VRRWQQHRRRRPGDLRLEVRRVLRSDVHGASPSRQSPSTRTPRFESRDRMARRPPPTDERRREAGQISARVRRRRRLRICRPTSFACADRKRPTSL
jgi:hypothetical protein